MNVQTIIGGKMKITSIQRDISLKQGFPAAFHEGKFKENYGASVYKNKRGLNANNSGDFTSKSEVAAISFNGVGSKIAKSGWFNWLLVKTQEHNVPMNAFIALILAGVLRPIATISLPGKKDKEDKMYASGHAIASGVVGFLFSTIVTAPLDDTIKKIKNDPAKYAAKSLAKLKKEAHEGATEASRNMAARAVNSLETCLKNIPDWIIAVPRAMLTIALIPPILKYVFGLEKKKKPENAVPADTLANVNLPQSNGNKLSIEDFGKGGTK